MKERSPFFRPVHQFLLGAGGLVFLLVALAAFYSARFGVIVLGIGLGLGVLVTPVISFLRTRLKVPRSIAVLLTFLTLVIAFLGAVTGAAAIAADQIVPLLSKLPDLLSGAQKEATRIFRFHPQLLSALNGHNLSQEAQKLVPHLLKGFQTGAKAVTGFLFVFAVALYYSLSPESYRDSLISCFPYRYRLPASNVLTTVGCALRSWFSAQMIAITIVGGVTALGLRLVGMEYWLAFGLITAILDIVPYVGPIVAAISACIVTLGTQPSDLVWVLVVYVIAQQFEGHVVIPLVMKGRIDLPPVHLLTMMLFFGIWFGLIGVLIAPPTLAIVRSLWLRFYPFRPGIAEIDQQRAS